MTEAAYEVVYMGVAWVLLLLCSNPQGIPIGIEYYGKYVSSSEYAVITTVNAMESSPWG